MSRAEAFNAFSIGKFPRCDPFFSVESADQIPLRGCGSRSVDHFKERLRKSASTTSTPSTTRYGQSFLPTLEHWSSKSMKHSKSSPGNLRVLVDSPLKELPTQTTATASPPEERITPSAAKQRRTRALVYNWPAHFNKESMLQVTPGPVRAPYELDVSYDLRAREHEFVKQKAYVVAFDAETVRKKFAAGMGLNPLEATNSFMTRVCCCSDVVPLTSSHGRATVKLNLADTPDSELVIFLRVIRSGNLKVLQDWYPIGDAVVVRVDQISDEVRKSMAETVTKEIMDAEAPISNEALEALGLEMDRVTKIESVEQLEKLEEELGTSLKDHSDDSGKRQQQHDEVKARCEDALENIAELQSELRKIEEQTAEMERTSCDVVYYN